MFSMVEWLLEVLDEDRKMFNTAAEESQESETNELTPELAKVHEAPGFKAMARAADWVEKYRNPASGGGRPGTGGDGNGSRRKKTKRGFLDTNDDQVFNKREYCRVRFRDSNFLSLGRMERCAVSPFAWDLVPLLMGA